MIEDTGELELLEFAPVPGDELSHVQVEGKVHKPFDFARKVALSVEEEPLELDAQNLGKSDDMVSLSRLSVIAFRARAIASDDFWFQLLRQKMFQSPVGRNWDLNFQESVIY